VLPAPAPEPVVRLRHVSQRFASGTEALAGLDLGVAPGELLALLGPSGCGKSTALRLMAGLLAPTAGLPEPPLMPWATVERNVALPLKLLGLPRAEIRRRVGERLERLGLDGFARAYPRQLSGGMKMRVSIARALAARPRLLLLDEPFAALDEITRWRLNDQLLDLWRTESLAIVFVTHSVYESAYLATRIAVFSARPGRIVGEVAVDAPIPRGADYRDSEAYLRTCRAVSARLAEALGGQGES
jgi:NitT/TauT family transport system ATP-binding protein